VKIRAEYSYPEAGRMLGPGVSRKAVRDRVKRLTTPTTRRAMGKGFVSLDQVRLLTGMDVDQLALLDVLMDDELGQEVTA
jgi:hypothetical protein